MKVMLTGSEHISALNVEAKSRLDTIISKGFHIVCGNYRGADQAMLSYLQATGYKNVTVYETGTKLSFGFAVKDVGRYPAQDIEMQKSDFLFALYDGKSKGTLRNIKAFPNRCRIVEL